MKKPAPPGWAPHQITHRVDGWLIDPEDEDRIPAAVAKMIVQAAPQLGGESVGDIKARMIARHNIMKRAQIRQRKFARMLKRANV
jgi:hypothetical protein